MDSGPINSGSSPDEAAIISLSLVVEHLVLVQTGVVRVHQGEPYAEVSEWLKETDCKSVTLSVSGVQIPPSAPMEEWESGLFQRS